MQLVELPLPALERLAVRLAVPRASPLQVGNQLLLEEERESQRQQGVGPAPLGLVEAL